MADRKTKKATQTVPEKQSSKRKLQPTQEKPKPQTQSSEELILKQFCTVVQDAHTALSDQRCRNAEQAFSQALSILQSSGTKGLGVSELDKTLLIYGYSTALIEIGQPEELLKAQKQFEELSSSGERKFQSLVHYGMGKVYLKENRFAKALEEFSNALLMLKRQITPGKLTWPTTKVTVEETQPEHLKNLLEHYIEMCKFPAEPDAVCRHQHCLGNAVEIYFTDPDFKGFIRMSCCQNCNVEFHIGCWKKIKAASFADKNDKDFLQNKCLTPDCTGKICQIVIFGSTGLIKCKFETSIPKIQLPGRMKVKQKCTSLKKLKSKENRKLKRRQRRAAASVAEEGSNNQLTAEDEKENKKEEKATPTGHTLYGDRVLHQIYESRELFNDEISSISSIMICLKPWLELDECNGHVSMLKDRAEPRVLRDLVDLLLERRNRVWARLFVHNLSDCLNIKPKLHDWAQQLDKAGLKAAEKFIGCYGEVLGNLDLSMLLQFPPLQNVLIEKFGAMPELFETGLAVSDYIRQAPPQEMRLFIWTLEEHREQHPSCITLLDEYFEMDGICLVIRKTDDNLSSVYKSKSKHRKKRQKEPKPLIVLSGMRSRLQRDEEDEDIFFEDNSLMLLDDTDPFSVPDYLREQVADFEEQYVSLGPINRHKRFLDNNRDPTKEGLYDYFAQILEEHGPLEASDPLLVGELKNFPTEAQQKILAAGGLKAFLTESLRFVLIDNLIALTQHSVSLQNANHNVSFTPMCGVIEPFSTLSSYLNPAAKEFLPQSKPLSLSDSSASYGSPDFLTAEGLAAPFDSLPVTDPALPTPYVCGSRFPHYNYRFDLYNIDTPENQVQGEDDFLRPENGFNSGALSSDASDSDAYPEKGGEETASASIYEEDTKADSVNVSVQTDVKNISVKDEVAVNTEPYTVFEKNKGDMTAIEKNISKFETTVQCVMETQESLHKKRTEHVSTLEAEVEEIHQKTEIANKELRMFQQMLEEEIRKEQQERRENQETLKALKGEIKELEDLLQSYSKQIQEKNMEYQTELDHFLATSNHNAAEKLNLEEQIKKCKDACAKAASQLETARLSVLCNRREKGLRRLKKNLSDWKVTLQNLTEMSSRFPSAGLLSSTEAWKAFVRDTEEKITWTEGQYEEQIELVKKGTGLSSLPPILVPSAPTPPPAPTFVHPPSSQPLPTRHPASHNPYGAQHQQQRAARSQAHPVRNAPLVQPASRATPSPLVAGAAAPFVSGEQAPRAPQHMAVLEKIVDRLSFMFPHYSRPVLFKFIQEARAVNGGTLNTLTYVDLINRVSSLILDHQEESLEQMSCVSGELASGGERAAPSPTPPADSFRATATSPPAHAWKSVSTQHRSSSKALNVEDPCIICHEDMLPEHVCVLQCRHSFHRECIKSWLKEQSTCPTCREHTLLPEDFPTLPHRRGHTSATSFF